MKTQPVNSTDIIFKGKFKIKHFKIIMGKKKEGYGDVLHEELTSRLGN